MPGPYKLLVVDDEEEIRNGMCRYFPWDQVGMEVTGFAPDGRQALDFLLHHPVDILLCDIRMPVMDGLELAKAVRQAHMDTTIIFLSAHRDFEYARKAIEYGVRQYLVKSAKYPEMVQVFQAVRKELDATRGAAPPPLEAPAEAPSHSFHEKVVAVVQAYVAEHLGENPNLENMAHHVSLNADYLGKIFKAHTGENFSDFLMRLRMERAAGLMDDIALKTYEIGALVGYHNPKNFTRAFKSYHGVSPRGFRNPR